MPEDLIYLDVREAGEGALEGVIPGSIHLPLRN